MNVINRISLYVVPVILMTTVSIGLYKNIKVFEIFLQGAKTGLDTAVRLVPTLVGLIVAIGMFRASGAMELFVYALSPITEKNRYTCRSYAVSYTETHIGGRLVDVGVIRFKGKRSRLVHWKACLRYDGVYRNHLLCNGSLLRSDKSKKHRLCNTRSACGRCSVCFVVFSHLQAFLYLKPFHCSFSCHILRSKE